MASTITRCDLRQGGILLDNWKNWSDRAEEVRVIAEIVNDPGTKRTLLLIAQRYDTLAERANNRALAEASRRKRA